MVNQGRESSEAPSAPLTLADIVEIVGCNGSLDEIKEGESFQRTQESGPFVFLGLGTFAALSLLLTGFPPACSCFAFFERSHKLLTTSRHLPPLLTEVEWTDLCPDTMVAGSNRCVVS